MFFGIGKSTFLGVDFGTSLIKAVELGVENGKPKLLNYGQVDLARLEKGIMTGENSRDDEIALYLRALLNKLQPKSKGIYAAMPAFTGLVSLIELPLMEEDELKDAIQFEAHKYIPSALEDVVLSWEVVGGTPATAESPVGKMEVLLVAALNKEVHRYQKYVHDVKMKMNFLELETFSLVRSIIHHKPGVYLVIDIGSRATNLVLVDDGLVKVSRNLDAGGGDVTRTLTDALSITPERAEALKKSEKDFLNTKESALIFPSLEMIASEGKRMLAAYAEKYPERPCQGVTLSGGTAHLTGLVEYYERHFGITVQIGNPFENIMVDSKISADVHRLGTAFSVAIGLALAGLDKTDDTHRQKTLQKPFSLKEFLTRKI